MTNSILMEHFVCLFTFINEKHQYFEVRLDLESCFSKLRLHSLLGRSNVTLQIENTSNKLLFCFAPCH